MNLTKEEMQSVLSVIKLYRSWIHQTYKDQKEDLDISTKRHFNNTFNLIGSAQEKIEKNIEELGATSGENTESESGDSKPRAAESKVLVADDDDISVELMCSLLEDIGFAPADVASDGQEALEKITSASPAYDLIICDWKMPAMNGLEVHKQSKTSGHINDSVFILLTAIDDEILAERARKQGITEYLTKPLDSDEFEEKVRVFFSLQT